MNDIIEYRIEYFNKAYNRWDELVPHLRTTCFEAACDAMEFERGKAKGVKFRLGMRTCTPWCACAMKGAK